VDKTDVLSGSSQRNKAIKIHVDAMQLTAMSGDWMKQQAPPTVIMKSRLYCYVIYYAQEIKANDSKAHRCL